VFLVRPALFDLWLAVFGSFREGVLLASRHSGVPAVLVASVAIVIAFRTARRALHFAAETAFVCAVLIFCTSMGWIRF
jgi:hypothetical protein